MNFINSLFVEHSALQAIIVLSLISAAGIMMGKIRLFGISLGITFVFFIGILCGHFGLSINPDMLHYAESFGLVIFIYALGLQVGPSFFSSLRTAGTKLLVPSIAIVLTGTFVAFTASYICNISIADVSGLLCGATTNTPALAAAQQTLEQMNIDGSSAALNCALAYPLGVVGVIIAIAFMRRFIVRKGDLAGPDKEHKKNVFVASYRVTNPAIYDKSVSSVAANSNHSFVISRLWRGGKVQIPTGDKLIKENDILLIITKPEDTEALRMIFGEQENIDWNSESIDWNKIDSQLIAQGILITRPEINGKKLSSLRLRNNYGINISRVYRSGVELLATPDLRLLVGDRLTVVGEAESIRNVEKILGNAVKSLDEPNLVAVFIGIILGLALGCIPFAVPGISLPVKLGLAGGPIIMGIIVGTFGPRLHMVTYTTQSANMMLRALGLNLYLACLGLDAGKHFFETIVRPEGALWLFIGFIITTLPVILMGTIAMRVQKLDFGSVTGLICGSMANPMALNYANETIEGDNPSVAYATVYPVCIFLRIIIIQVAIMLLV